MPLVLDSLLFFFYASFAAGCVRHKGFTPKERNKSVELDARMNPTLSHATMSVPCCTVCLPLYGDMPRHNHGEAIFSMT